MNGKPVVVSTVFVDADGNPVAPDDPAATRAEIHWLDDDGNERRTYATVNGDPP